MKVRLLLLAAVLLLFGSNAAAQISDANTVPLCTVATLNTCGGGPEPGRAAWVLDALNVSTCSIGGGTSEHMCQRKSDGTWIVDGSPQTPWTANVNAAGFNLTGLGNATGTGTATFAAYESTCLGTGCGVTYPLVTGTPDNPAVNTIKGYDDDGELSWYTSAGLLGEAAYTPATSTDNEVCRMDGATGGALQGTTGFTSDDSGNVVVASINSNIAGVPHVRVGNNDSGTLGAGIDFEEAFDTGDFIWGLFLGNNANLNSDVSIRIETIATAAATATWGPQIVSISVDATRDTGELLCDTVYKSSSGIVQTCIEGTTISYGNATVELLTIVTCATDIPTGDTFSTACNVAN